jgi:hypothetical protein
MPEQTVRVKIQYTPIDDEGDLRPPPERWPFMDMCDMYVGEGCNCGDETRYYETVSCAVAALGKMIELEQDKEWADSWHQENCSETQCTASEEAQEKYPCTVLVEQIEDHGVNLSAF